MFASVSSTQCLGGGSGDGLAILQDWHGYIDIRILRGDGCVGVQRVGAERAKAAMQRSNAQHVAVKHACNHA